MFPRILVIEDDPDQRALICETLRIHYNRPDDDPDIVPAASGSEALAMEVEKFDAVLQDYNMPGISGLNLLQSIVSRADIPIIVVTGENVSSTAAEAIQSGASDYVVKLGDYLFALPILIDKNIRQHQIRKQNKHLQDELEKMVSEISEKNKQLQDSMVKLEKMATTDHLTGLANRRRFVELLNRYYSDAYRYNFDLTCCMCDLDHYKQLNDTLGHQKGDELLVLTAEIIRSSLRETDVAARYGGDEFVLLLPHTSVEDGMAVAQRMRQQMEVTSKSFKYSGKTVTMSVGIASLSINNPASADALVAAADKALYMAKEQGKDRVVIFGKAGIPQATI